ncbi:hypothetical protein ONE63_007170 [Megalurothrips usitatus]|uniref:Mitochondrial chaperone BCS1 n=1 Tax=Megalurothrips usitatus TaxID=439358 RepID=A0AAV7XVE5_9NEOP|nr:hypothetical protein ONE63_007170 [Megalurothrips usitatus]
MTISEKGMQASLMMFRRHYMTTMEVHCRDKSYQWVLQWMTEKGAKKTQHLSVETTYEHLESGHVKTNYNFMPSVGQHLFRYKNTWIKVERSRDQQTTLYDTPFETVTFTALSRDKSIYFSILEEARIMALKKEEGKLVMYSAPTHEWKPFGHPRRKRPITSVVLDSGVAERILGDVRDFLGNPSWYIERGIPYRRGYLLHGPPGCGKSSFIAALASELDLGICILSLSDRSLTDDRLAHLMAVAPHHTIILLEDIDAAFESRVDSDHVAVAYQGLNRVTLSGLLNCLDGVPSTEARIVFMTTNYIERLDPALIRPGRVDLKQYIGHCNALQLETMFLRFFSGPGVEGKAKEFSVAIEKSGKPVSPAQVQGFFMLFKDDPSAAVENAHRLVEVLS